jgi:hypothetical protein
MGGDVRPTASAGQNCRVRRASGCRSMRCLAGRRPNLRGRLHLRMPIWCLQLFCCSDIIAEWMRQIHTSQLPKPQPLHLDSPTLPPFGDGAASASKLATVNASGFATSGSVRAFSFHRGHWTSSPKLSLKRMRSILNQRPLHPVSPSRDQSPPEVPR